MPFTPPVQPTEVGTGRAALEFLESKGLVPVNPTIRASDLGALGRCRLHYLLTRRFGLMPWVADSDASEQGTWAHRWLQSLFVSDPTAFLARCLRERLDEIRTIGKAHKVSDEVILRTCFDTERRCKTALAWMNVGASIPVKDGQLKNGLLGFLVQRHWRPLVSELRFCYEMPKIGVLACTVDLLLYNENTKKVWVADLKTTRMSVLERLQLPRIEFACRHYSFIINEAMKSGVIHRKYDLPADAGFGGMMHLGISRPTIDLGQNDRPYQWVSVGVRSGKTAALTQTSPSSWEVAIRGTDDGLLIKKAPFPSEETSLTFMHQETGKKPEKVFEGEPSVDLYKKRVKDWYLGVGDYEKEREERETDPPVNISFVDASFLDSDLLQQYTTQLKWIASYANRPAYPCDFDPTSEGMRHMGSLSEWAPFYLNKPIHWPDIIIKERFIVRHRDDESVPTIHIGKDQE